MRTARTVALVAGRVLWYTSGGMRGTVGPMSLFGAVRLIQVAGAMARPQVPVASGELRPIRPEAWATWKIGAAVVEEADSSEGVHVATFAVLPVFGRATWSRLAESSGRRNDEGPSRSSA